MNEKIRELLESEDLKENQVGMDMLRMLTLGEAYEIVKSTRFVHETAFLNGNIVDFTIASLFDVPVAMLRGLCRKGGSSWKPLPQWIESRRYSKAVPGRYLELNYDYNVIELSEPHEFSTVDWMFHVLGARWTIVSVPQWKIKTT